MKISAEEIQLCFGKKEILKNISIHAKEKEFIGIIGPNGSGKSTFLKCVYRVLKPDNGCILLDNEAIQEMSYKKSSRKMAVVAQHNHYNFDFTVFDIVLMGRSPHKKVFERDTTSDYKIVEEALKMVGMEAFKNRSFSTLSGGEQQRVILARALAQQTPCLLLDEPTNHLDITNQLQLLRIVKNLNITVISAIHDLNIAAMFCDRLYVLKEGTIVAEGKPEEVLTKELIREIYQVDSEIVKDSNGQMHILFL